jgi:cytochrome c-type biogenesis protein CcmH/NrfG
MPKAGWLDMKKESVVILLIITFVAGFVAGAISGIKFYSKEKGSGQIVEGGPPPQGGGAPSGNPEEISRLETIVRSEPTNLQALVTLGNLYFDSNQFHKAIDVYERSLAIDPKNPDVLTDLGIMYRAIKEYDKAVKEFREAARLAPTHVNSRFNLGIVLQQDKKDIQGALAAWEDFLRVEPSGERASSVKHEIEQLKSLAK